MSITEKVTDVLTKHGWPPATLVVVAILTIALYTVYQDYRTMEGRWQALAQANLEANLIATKQREALQKMLQNGLTAQERHLKMIKDLDRARLQQTQLDQQLTGAAIQALRQMAEKLDVQVQMKKPQQLLDPLTPRR